MFFRHPTPSLATPSRNLFGSTLNGPLFLTLLFLLTHTLYAQSSIYIKRYTKFVASNEVAGFVYKSTRGAELSSCQPRFARSPKGPQISGHTELVSLMLYSSEDSLSFIPDAPNNKGMAQVPIGLNYLVIVCNTEKGQEVSNEVVLRVESLKSPKLIFPDAVLKTLTPSFSWTPVPGVPAYHILLSDQIIQLDPETFTPYGASIIWQAITTQTSLSYGAKDPANFFRTQKPPPLSSGNSYTLIVFNNYDGRTPAATGTLGKDFRIFKIEIPGKNPLEKPRLLNPKSGETYKGNQNPEINFLWTSAGAKALDYELYIYSEERFEGFDTTIALPVWNKVTTDTQLTLKASGILGNKKYLWKVFTQSLEGHSEVSDTGSFFYEVQYRNIEFHTKTIKADSTSGPLEGVKISYTTPDGAQTNFPLSTLADGTLQTQLIVGTYTFLFEKDGYFNQTLQVDLRNLDSSQNLHSLEALLTPQNSFITGQVTQTSGQVIPQVQITLKQSNGINYQTTTDAQGNFHLGVSAGNYTALLTHPSHLTLLRSGLVVGKDTTLVLDDLVLQRISTQLTGTVLNSSGKGLTGVDISIQSIGNENRHQEIRSQSDGSFQAALVTGKHIITLKKNGFADKIDTLDFTSSVYREYTLWEGASILTGDIRLVSHLTPNLSTTSLSPDVTLSLTFVQSNKTYFTQTRTSGNFSIALLDTGAFELRATLPLKTDTLLYQGNLKKSSTQNLSLFLPVYPQVSGKLILPPTGTLSLSGGQINLVNRLNDKIAYTVQPFIQNNRIQYLFPFVQQGNYLIQAALEGYGQEKNIEILVDSLWQTGIDIPLISAKNTLQVQAFHKNQPVPAKIEVVSPLKSQFLSKDTLKNASWGQYIVDVIPSQDSLLARLNLNFNITPNSGLDTLVQVELPYSSRPPRASPDFKYVLSTLSLDSATFPDSVFLVAQINSQISRTQLDSLKIGLNTLSTPIPISGGRVSTYFEVYSKNLRFSGQRKADVQALSLPPRQGLTFLELLPTDQISMVAGTSYNAYVHVYNGSNNSLNRELQTGRSIYWYTSDTTLRKADSMRIILTGNKFSSDSLGQILVKLKLRADSLIFKDSLLEVISRLDSLKQKLDSNILKIRPTLDFLTRQSQTYPIQLKESYGLFNTLTLKKSIAQPLPVYIRAQWGGDTLLDSIIISETQAKFHKLILNSNLGNKNEITHRDTVRFRVLALDTSKTPPQEVHTLYKYSIKPPQAARMDGDFLIVDSNFIGPLEVSVSARQGKTLFEARLPYNSDSLNRGIQVWCPLNPPFSTRTLFYTPEVELVLPDSFFLEGQADMLRLQKRDLNSFFTSTSHQELKTPLYEFLLFKNTPFKNQPKLTLAPLIPEETENLSLALYYDTSFSWYLPPPNTQFTRYTRQGKLGLSIPLLDFSGTYYGLLGKSAPLGVKNIVLMPNPFSPHIIAVRDGNNQPGLRVDFWPQSDKSDRVLTTIKIYNLRGELVRTLLDHKALPKSNQTLYWDGKTDDENWARNGRYIIIFLMQENTNSKLKKTVKNVVLFH